MVATKLNLPLPPSLNQLYRRGKQGGLFKTDIARAWEAEVYYRLAPYHPREGNIALTITVYYKNQRSDVDNFLKILLDALEGHIYSNDNQVNEIHLFKYCNKLDPHIEVIVAP